MAMSLPLTTDEAEYVLQDIIRREQQRLLLILKPYMAELGHLAAYKRPAPVMLEGGRIAHYVGPTASDISGPYQAPSWLREMAVEDPGAAYSLRRYREHMGMTTPKGDET